ncbi:MAG TPA: RecX family transcriptional regulator [Tepidisphaeraceae bacterium]|jgi:regulatory protein|nr:RecX family transcriptional regulator [Tepidisphaeraceae bacterium]
MTKIRIDEYIDACRTGVPDLPEAPEYRERGKSGVREPGGKRGPGPWRGGSAVGWLGAYNGAMAVITRIVEAKRRRHIYLDGKFAFSVKLNVVARFRLREGMKLSGEQIEEIEQGEVRQECLDRGIKYLSGRLHSREELRKKLLRQEYLPGMVEEVLEELARLGYVNDERFAKTKALAAAQHKHHGPRRAMVELMRAGVKREVAEVAVGEVYENNDNIGEARRLVEKQAGRLRKLEPQVARRRLVGMLVRRGFEYDAIRPVIEEVLGREQE